MNEVTLTIISIIFIIMIIVLIDILRTYIRSKIIENDNKNVLKSLTAVKMGLDNTKEILDILNTLIREKCIVEFQNFTDEYKFDMTNKSQIKNLIENVCLSVENDTSELKDVCRSMGVLKERYFDNYIIDLVTYCIKNLVTDTITKMENNA